MNKEDYTNLKNYRIYSALFSEARDSEDFVSILESVLGFLQNHGGVEKTSLEDICHMSRDQIIEILERN